MQPTASQFRPPDDTARYRSTDGALRDPLLALEGALHRYYGGGATLAAASGVPDEVALAMARPVPPEKVAAALERASMAAQVAAAAFAQASLSTTPIATARPPSSSRGGPTDADMEAASDAGANDAAYDRVTPFPFSGVACAQDLGPHAVFLAQLYVALRFGSGDSTVLLTDTMGPDTPAAVVEDSRQPGARCEPFAQRLVGSLPTKVVIRSSPPVGAANWLDRIARRKADDRERRYPMLTAGGRRVPPPDGRLDFATDRDVGLLGMLGGLLPGAVTTRSSCGAGGGTGLAPHSTTGLAIRPFVTGEWIEVDLRPWAVAVWSYALASVAPITGGAPPRHWVLEACHNNGPWSRLREHVGDASISHQRTFCVWDVDTPGVVCNRLRVLRTGPDALGKDTLQVASLELYGRLLCCWPHTGGGLEVPHTEFHPDPAVIVQLSTAPKKTEFPLPPEPVSKKKKKK